MQIDKKTHKIPSENYYKTKNNKNQIILAGSLRADSNHIKRLTKKSFGKTKKWCTYTISRDGTIYQHYDPKFYTDFMGEKKVDKHSISIVLENMGSVYYNDDIEKWNNWVNEICDEELVYERNWKGNRYWESYTEEQFISTVELCKKLCEDFNIILDSIGNNVYLSRAEDFEGIVTRSNFDIEYTDVNPHFDFKRFLNEIGIEI